MTKKTKDLPFEERLNRLQVIVAALESGEKPLEESVALYKEGLAHAAACREQLSRARHDIEVYSNGACAPFTPDRGGEDDAGDDFPADERRERP